MPEVANMPNIIHHVPYVAALLGRYPEVFDPAVNPEAVRVAVTGRVPAPADFGKYPSYIRFDGVWDADYTPAQLERIALISADFSDYSQWNVINSFVPSKGSTIHTVCHCLRIA